MDKTATTQMFERLSQLADAAMPLMSVMAGTALGLVLISLGAGWLLRHAENAVAGLALRMEDGRKKKRDEYDAYYDARLAESPEPDTTNIAYYEEQEEKHADRFR